MKNLLLVGFGGFLGSTLRYAIYQLSSKFFSDFYAGTLIVNLSGSLLIGLLAGLLVKPSYQHYQLFLITGFCGGFTTFSTFSMEGLRLLQNDQFTEYVWYTGFSIVGGLTLCFLGVWIIQKFVQ